MKKNIILSVVALFLCLSSARSQTENSLYDRMVMIEEFTTEYCPNCPPVASVLKQVMELENFDGKLLAVTHHSGYYTDWLTTDADIEYKWFYNYKSTYAPAIMFDRYPFFETKGRPGTDQRKKTPVEFINSLDQFSKYIKRRLNKKAHVGFYLEGKCDDDNTIKVRVSGERDSLFTETAPRITVFLVENGILAQSQAGAYGEYYHDHVLRTYNNTWGEEINWIGDAFDYQCELKMKPEWNRDNLQLIAFVHAFDPEDPANCTIENARIIGFDTILGISDVNNDGGTAKTEYFTTDGIKTDALTKGLYIEKKTYSDGKTSVRKVNL